MSVPFIEVTLDSKVIEKVKVNQEILAIGRAEDNDIVINNLSVSRYHAMIQVSGGEITIKDLGSSNGTFVNGQKVDLFTLEIGDSILVGKHVLKLGRETDRRYQALGFPEIEGTVVVDSETQDRFLRRLGSDFSYRGARLISVGGKEVTIDGDFFTIGNDESADLKLDGIFVRSTHATIIRHQNGTYRIINMGFFFNPTKINGTKVNEKALKNGDLIEIGSHKLMFFG